MEVKRIYILTVIIAFSITVGCNKTALPNNPDNTSEVVNKTPLVTNTIEPTNTTASTMVTDSSSSINYEEVFKSNPWYEIQELRGRILEVQKETLTKSEYEKLIENPVSYTSIAFEDLEGALFCSSRNIVLSYPVIEANKTIGGKKEISYIVLPDKFSKDLLIDEVGKNVYIMDRKNGIFAVLKNDDSNKHQITCAFKLENNIALEKFRLLSVYSQ
ncbi:MAG: hypothetical protein GX660_26820, partial [Clostridiaceae bacterium]|nr:hypothetical protein [Clostridiaceae bacterium]